MESGSPSKKSVSLGSFVNQSWYKGTEGSSAWIVAYRAHQILGVDKHTARLLDLEQVRVVLLSGGLRYPLPSKPKRQVRDGALWYDRPTVETVAEVDGFYLLLITPHHVDGTAGIESATKSRLQRAVGILVANFGKNIAFEKLFEHELDIGTSATSHYTEVLENPLWFNPVHVSDDNLNPLIDAWHHLESLPTPERDRIRMSLEWFQSAVDESDGAMSFLKYWIAIETLAMQNETDIRTVSEILSRVYAISVNQAKKLFCIGQVFGLRGKIVHNGRRPPIHGSFLRYMEALYFDLFSFHVGAKSLLRAQQALKHDEYNTVDYLRSALSTK